MSTANRITTGATIAHAYQCRSHDRRRNFITAPRGEVFRRAPSYAEALRRCPSLTVEGSGGVGGDYLSLVLLGHVVEGCLGILVLHQDLGGHGVERSEELATLGD